MVKGCIPTVIEDEEEEGREQNVLVIELGERIRALELEPVLLRSTIKEGLSVLMR